jgi:hypothetical protein
MPICLTQEGGGVLARAVELAHLRASNLTLPLPLPLTIPLTIPLPLPLTLTLTLTLL